MTDTAPQTGMPSFPLPIPGLMDEPAEYSRLRDNAPVIRVVMPTGDKAWLVTRYEDVRTLLADTRFSRAATLRDEAPKLRPIRPDAHSSIFSMDPPDHTRLRRLVASAFTHRRTSALRSRVRALTEELIAQMVEGGRRANLIADYALPIPRTVICEILGVPLADRERFREWTDRILSLGAYSSAEVRSASEELDDYFNVLVSAKSADPGDDLLSALTLVQEEGDRLSRAELVTFGGTLLTAGMHTTAMQVGLAMAGLLIHRDQWEKLVREPDLVPNAVEEVLRYNVASSAGGLIRVALTDVELGGVVIPAGDAVLPAIVSANRDGAANKCPHALDVSRQSPKHLTFGHGIHHCLGAHLARIEISEAIGSLVRQIPNLRIAVAESDLEVRGQMLHRILDDLPVEW